MKKKCVFINKMKKVSFIGVLLICLLACNFNDYKEIKKFPVEENLQGVLVNKDYFLQSSHIHILNDSLALFYAQYNSDKVFYFIHPDDFSLINECGVIGKGPGELINAGFLHIDKHDIWISDGMQMKIFRFPIDSALNQANYLPTRNIHIYSNDMIFLYEIKNNEIVFYNGPWGEQIFTKVEGAQKNEIGVKRFNFDDDLNADMNLNAFHYKRHPEKDLLALAYCFDDFLTIMNNNGEIMAQVKGPDFFDPIKEWYSEERISTYNAIQVDEENIYCLYHGGSMGAFNEAGVFVGNEAQTILVFDWEGEPIKKIILEYSAYSFDLDKSRNRIVTYCSEMEEEIVYYNYKF